MKEEQKRVSAQKLLDVISKKNTDPENEKAAAVQWDRLNNTKARKRPLIYLFAGVFAGIIATGGIFYLLNSPDSKSAKSTAAEKVQTASSASQEKKYQDTDADKIIQTAISRWKTAWEQKDINAYKAFYSHGFHTAKSDRRTWFDNKEKNFQKPGNISINIQELTISVEGRHAVATFVQRHNSPGLTDKGIKTLIWVNENNEWKIVSETWKPLRK